MKRREFIKSTGAAATAILLAPKISFSLRKNDLKVIIIGGGIAGLSAAYKLLKSGVDVVILESRNRIGGRIFTHQIDEKENLTVELGGEWIGESHTRMKELCTELGLKLLNHQFDTHLILDNKYYKHGEWDFDAGWNSKYKNLLDNFNSLSNEEKLPFDKLDWWRFLKNNNISERDLEIKELLDSTDFGETIRNVSAYAGITEYAESSPKNEMDYHIDGGNGKIIEKLAEKIGQGKIKLKHKVISIEQKKDGVSVKCENGSNWEADKIICTIPTFSIKNIEWKPELSKDKKDALNELQYCRINKTSVLFKERFWKDESLDMVTDNVSHYFYHSTKNQNGKMGVLTSFASGDRAYVMSKMNESQKIDAICETLKPAFGDVKKYIEKTVSYYWGNDLYTQGAYAIYDTNEWMALREILSKPEGNIFFAGEHLADWQGFMEGAVNTGEDAADQILNG